MGSASAPRVCVKWTALYGADVNWTSVCGTTLVGAAGSRLLSLCARSTRTALRKMGWRTKAVMKSSTLATVNHDLSGRKRPCLLRP
jgi:hypothetical protein